MEDDDDFFYDDEYDASVSSCDDHDLEAEMELDDLKSASPAEKATIEPRLRELATRPTCHAIAAATDLITLNTTISNYEVMISSVINAVDRIALFTKVSAVTQASQLVLGVNSPNLAKVLPILARAVADSESKGLKEIEQKFRLVYAAAQIENHEEAAAAITLDRLQFETTVETTAKITNTNTEDSANSANLLAANLKYEEMLLRLNLLMRAPELDVARFEQITGDLTVLTKSRTLNAASHALAYKKEEAEARLSVERQQFADARRQLMYVVRGHEEQLALSKPVTSLLEPVVLLVLVSIICDFGPYDLALDFPPLKSLISHPIIAPADKLGAAFTQADLEDYLAHRSVLSTWLASMPWQLGTATLLRKLDALFDERQVLDYLSYYTRKNISTIDIDLVSMPPGSESRTRKLELKDLETILRNSREARCYRLNLVNMTVDSMKHSRPPQRRKKLKRLPPRYAKMLKQRAQDAADRKILGREVVLPPPAKAPEKPKALRKMEDISTLNYQRKVR